MANTPNPTACATTWNAEELRDEILLHLPISVLLHARRVCKDWAASSIVQEVLFIKPRSSHHVEVVPSKGSIDVMAANNAHGDQWVLVDNNVASNRKRGFPILNPLLPFDELPIDDSMDMNVSYTIAIPAPLLLATPSIASCCPCPGLNGTPDPRWADPIASWRGMQLMQPPATRIRLFCLGGYLHAIDIDRPDVNDGEIFEGVDVVNADGVTAGEVVQAMDEHYGACEMCKESELDGEWPFHGSAELTLKSVETTGHEMLEEIQTCY